MKRNLKTYSGIISAVSLLLVLNYLVWKQEIFNLWILLFGGIFIISGVAWLVFVFLNMVKESGWSGRAASGLNAIVSTLAFLGICIVLYAFVLRWNVSIDLTQEGRRSISPQTIKVLQSINKEVKVLCFSST
jgi:drug/metabolite transporter superfamily protein YnfA